jgi:hypothetical protein
MDWPSGLRSAADTAAVIGISEERLLDLADSGFAPHWRIDGGDPLFRPSEVKAWAAANLLQRNEARPLPFDLRVVFEPPRADHNIRPLGLSQLDGLRDITPLVELCSGVYFLCAGPEVIYVGQSIEPAVRIASHRTNGLSFSRIFFLPVPQWRLNAVEAAFIRLLQPLKNGGRTKNGGMRTVDTAILQEFLPGLAPLAETPVAEDPEDDVVATIAEFAIANSVGDEVVATGAGP